MLLSAPGQTNLPHVNSPLHCQQLRDPSREVSAANVCSGKQELNSEESHALLTQ